MTFGEMVVEAIDAVHTHNDLNIMYGRAQGQSQNNQDWRSNNWNCPQGGQCQPTQGDRPNYQSYQQPYNSTNAPCSYNDRPVPMDIGRGRFRCQDTQGNVARTENTSHGNCYTCQKLGHYARECPEKPRPRCTQAHGSEVREERYDEIGDFLDDSEDEGTDKHIRSFNQLSAKEKHEMVRKIDTEYPEDFPST
jgi:hypothetical protein